ncbi:efflux RND transporter permease subunit [Candidatus Uabimicrobium amorphum]|uniref:Acriflavin resistance protein n=1 Tax=Uabimicrobium amorphum TaxID=2596890 RepID=A0A5S9F2J6_UABAM|nr:efflux RND transporter permease subunit [Candidatus Uabimicrobium amorphum]BBM82444.1 acriflavin resistance protein [Candidatus Uabimicrobium amorphum]
MNLLTLFYRNRYLLACAIVIAMVSGTTAFLEIPRLEDPRLDNRNAIILTSFPGASAARVESLVTEKIEAQLLEIKEIKTMKSTSRAGISSISVELQDSITNTNNQDIFSKIRDELKDAKQFLPKEVGEPVLDDTRTTSFTVVYALSSSNTNLSITSRLATELANRFRNVSGTEIVRVYGSIEEEYRVELNVEEVTALGITPQEIQNALTNADVKTPAGVMYGSKNSIAMEVRGAFDTIATIENTPIRNGMLFLRDIAVVKKIAKDPPQEIGIVQNNRAILIAARIQENEQMHKWMETIHHRAKLFRRYLDDETTLRCVFDQGKYTYKRLLNLYENLIMGCVLVMMIIFLVMGWRSAVIVSFALPFSVALALFIIMLSGEQLHQMSIFGMIIAVGLLIDNAIVVTDEVVMHIHNGCGRLQAIEKTIRHLFVPLLSSTFTTVLGFMPVFLLAGNIGDFISSIAKSVVASLCVSFLASMTIIPALAAIFARKSTHRWWQRGLRSKTLLGWYSATLKFFVKYRKMTVFYIAGVALFGFIAAAQLQEQFFPGADRNQFEIQVWLPEQSSIYETQRTVREMNEQLQKFTQIDSFMWMIGNSFPSVYYNMLMTKDNSPFYANAIVNTKNANIVRHLVPQIQNALNRKFPQAQCVVRIFGQGPPREAPLEFRIYGVSIDKLRHYGEKIKAILLNDEQVLHAQTTITSGIPKLWLDVDRRETLTAGLTLKDIATKTYSSIQGVSGGSVLEELEEIPVTIRYPNDYRRKFYHIATMNVQGVPLNAIGRLEMQPTTNAITRYNHERCNIVRGYLYHDALPIEVTKRVMQKIRTLQLEEGYSISIGGDSEEKGKAVASLLRYIPVLMTLMLATLVLTFNRLSLTFIIGCVAILSVGFGLFSLWMFSYPLGFNPFLGIAGLIGIALNDTIVVLAGLHAIKGKANPQQIVDTVVHCTRHILSTTLTTIASFLPLLLFSGGTFWPPLAIVISGGIFGATTLSLIFVPCLFCIVYDVKDEVKE